MQWNLYKTVTLGTQSTGCYTDTAFTLTLFSSIISSEAVTKHSVNPRSTVPNRSELYTAQKSQIDLLRVCIYILAKESLELKKCSCLSWRVQRVLLRQTSRPFPVQTSPSWYSVWRFWQNCVEKSRSHVSESPSRFSISATIGRIAFNQWLPGAISCEPSSQDI